MRLRSLSVVLLLLAALLPARAAGELIACARIGVYERAALDRILVRDALALSPRAADYRPPAAVCAVKLYRVTYNTLNPDNRNAAAKASGLLALPVVPDRSCAVVLWSHSAELTAANVPSRPDASVEARLVIAALAGQGYAVLMPDYLGKGSFPGVHPFFLPESEARAGGDLLSAGRKACAQLNVRLQPRTFLAGWSQGGQATLALLKLLEERGDTTVRAAAPVAGIYDLYLQWQAWLTRPHAPLVPALMLYTLKAYEKHLRLDGLYGDAVQPQYADLALGVKRLLDTDSGARAIQMTPHNAVELFAPGFRREAWLGVTPFYRALRRSEVYAWRPRTLVRFYYGQADDIATPDQALLAAGYMQGLGANVVAVSAGAGAGHGEAFLFALREMKPWFDSL